jgi:dienelactone hydrolase
MGLVWIVELSQKKSGDLYYDPSSHGKTHVKHTQIETAVQHARADINLLKETLTKYEKTFDIKTYPDAPHGFFNDTRESYRSDAAKDSWQRTLKFYSKYLKT